MADILSDAAEFVLFSTQIGWLGVLRSEDLVQRITIGHPSAIAANNAMEEVVADLPLPPRASAAEKIGFQVMSAFIGWRKG